MSAQKSQGAILSVATANGSPKTVTGATAANPPVITSTAHGLLTGTVGLMSGIVGMTQLNSRAFVLANPLTNSFELKGVDGTAYTTYGSGGIWTPKTMTALGDVRAIGPGFDGEASEIDVTSLSSTAKEYLLGLQDFGNVRVGLFLPSGSDTGHARLRALKESAAAEAFTITLASGQVAAFMALVKSFSFDEISPDGVAVGSVNLRVTNAPAWFA
jgi:hypothetical protein